MGQVTGEKFQYLIYIYLVIAFIYKNYHTKKKRRVSILITRFFCTSSSEKQQLVFFGKRIRKKAEFVNMVDLQFVIL